MVGERHNPSEKSGRNPSGPHVSHVLCPSRLAAAPTVIRNARTQAQAPFPADAPPTNQLAPPARRDMALNVTQIRDTKWLTLEVCREFQRGTCSRPDSECKFAHPAKSCQVENGRVIACFDSLKVSERTVQRRLSSVSPLLCFIVLQCWQGVVCASKFYFSSLMFDRVFFYRD